MYAYVGVLHVWVTVYTAVCVYWLASLLVVRARVRSSAFAALTSYGGRVLASRRAQEETATASPLSPPSSPLRWLQQSWLGRCRVQRQAAFCAFYVCGLVTCALLWRAQQQQPHSSDGNVTSTASASASVSSRLLRDARVAPLRRGEALPLLAFALHCLLRLYECVCVQRFRGGHDDRVTLFALLAGCTFYVAAALSSSTVLLATLRAHALTQRQQQLALSSGDAVRLPPVTHNTMGVHAQAVRLQPFFATLAAVSTALPRHVWYAVLYTLFALHLALQLTQMVHHVVLARLRAPLPQPQHASSSPPHSSSSYAARSEAALRVVQDAVARHLATAARIAIHDDGGDVRWLRARRTPPPPPLRDNGHSNSHNANAMAAAATTTPPPPPPTRARGSDSNASSGGAADARVWRYHFPTTLLFRHVLEPHYLCEVCMYAVQWTMMVLLVCFGVCAAPAAVRVYASSTRQPPPHTLLVAHDDTASGSDVVAAAATLSCAYASSPVLPYYYNSGSGDDAVACGRGVHRATAMLLCCVTLQLAAALGVCAFTLANLACTAREHRAFWRYVTDEREYAAMVLQTQSSSSSSNNARLRSDVQRLLRRELLPTYNLVPGVW